MYEFRLLWRLDSSGVRFMAVFCRGLFENLVCVTLLLWRRGPLPCWSVHMTLCLMSYKHVLCVGL